MLEINDLKKTFDNGSPALKGVNLKINKGEFVSILGPSSSGKTTLLRTINGLETSSGGEIYFDNKKIDKNKNTFLITFLYYPPKFYIQMYPNSKIAKTFLQTIYHYISYCVYTNHNTLCLTSKTISYLV